MEKVKPVGGKIWTESFKILTILAVIAGVLLIKRFVFGIGAVTNLSHGYPWGLWIVYDVVVGTAIACGGYVMALLVYVFNRGQYHPLVRSALLASVFGYTLAGFSIFIDIGRYWNMLNVLSPWYANANSIMFEVAFCVATYILVMWVEFSPAFFEAAGKEYRAKWINRVMFFFVALGVLLPTMHQSSLGTLMIIAGHKLDALWQTPWLPLLFLITAIGMGFAIVIFESLYSSLIMRRPYETPMLSRIARGIPWLLAIFFVIRFTDLLWRDTIMSVFQFNLKGLMFWIENIFFVHAIYVMSVKSRREERGALFAAAVSMIMGGAIYRFNTFLVGFNPGEGWHYFPSVSEIMITVGIVAFELMAYNIFVKRFPVLPEVKHAN
jgi:Ni/Fe-hydrogenase subunit HybB-like protein